MAISQREREYRARHIMVDVSGHWKPLFHSSGEPWSREDIEIVRKGLEGARNRTQGLVDAFLWRAHASHGEEMDLRVLVESAYLQGWVDAASTESGAALAAALGPSASSPEGSTPPTPDAEGAEPR